jgi:hypothetical protein
MKNKRVTILAADINAGTLITIDPSMPWDIKNSIGVIDHQTLYPISLQIINDCGAGVEFNIINSIIDYADYQIAASIPATVNDFYAFQKVPNGGLIHTDYTKIPRCYKFLIRGYEVGATKDLAIEFIGYTKG